MCTMIAEKIEVEGSGKNGNGWFKIKEAYVSYDHPFDAPFEHALNLDFVNEAQGPGTRVAVELSTEAALALVEAIQSVLQKADERGHIVD